MNDNIESGVKQIIADQFFINAVDVDLSADMGAKYGTDSLDQVEIVLIAEDEFKVEIADDDMFAVKTAQQLIDLVRAQLVKERV